jgi:hypothetical protein
MKKSTFTIIGCIIGGAAAGFFISKQLNKKQPVKQNNDLSVKWDYNNWDDEGGYRLIIISSGNEFYFNKNGAFMGRSNRQGNWVAA